MQVINQLMNHSRFIKDQSAPHLMSNTHMYLRTTHSHGRAQAAYQTRQILKNIVYALLGDAA